MRHNGPADCERSRTIISCREPALSGSEGCEGCHVFLQIPIAIGTGRWRSGFVSR